MADQPCSKCSFYDPILRGSKEHAHGRCAAQSTYPHTEQPGQVFPAGVKREAPGELAKPVIVTGDETVTNCNLFRAKPVKTS